MNDLYSTPLILGIVIGLLATTFGIILGYEIGRSARLGKPLFTLPKFRKKQPDTAKGRQYRL